MEENPLQICSNTKNICTNKRGRPTLNTIVNFGPQPKSIVAQMLSNLSTDHPSRFINDSSKADFIEYLQPDKTDDKVTGTQMHEIHTEILCENSDEMNQTVQDDITIIFDKRAEISNDHDKCKTTLREFTCDHPCCNYTCKLSSNLIKHKRIHTNEKPYLCDQCSFRSNFINSLKAHKRTHTAERPYQCEFCSYKCNTSSNLKKHCRHRHSEHAKGHVT